MEKVEFLSILRELRNECKRVNGENLEKDPNCEVIYEVLQLSDLSEKFGNVYDIANFYNINWQGNKDFMHIPDFGQTLSNCMRYPIIIARRKNSDEILGISTIKYDENSNGVIDPYFPEEDAKYFSITGILTKKENPYRGIGKKIYEIAIRGVHNFEKYYPGTRIMCVIDCRNRQSLRALASAVNTIKENGFAGEGKELPASMVGYYELRDKENDNLLEAPTLVLEVGLTGKNIGNVEANGSLQNLSYRRDDDGLFKGLLRTLKDNLKNNKIREPRVIEDEDCGMVYYYSIDDSENCKINNIQIESNGTEQGNDRVPRSDIEMKSFIGPIPVIRISDEEVR